MDGQKSEPPGLKVTSNTLSKKPITWYVHIEAARRLVTNSNTICQHRDTSGQFSDCIETEHCLPYAIGQKSDSILCWTLTKDGVVFALQDARSCKCSVHYADKAPSQCNH